MQEELGQKEAVATYCRQFEARRRLLGEDNPLTWTSGANLAEALSLLDDPEAWLLRRETVERLDVLLGPYHPDTIGSMAELAGGLLDRGTDADCDEAVELLTEVLRLRTASLGPDHPDTALARSNLGAGLFRLDRDEEALALFEAAVTTFRACYGDGHPSTLQAEGNAAAALVAMGRADEAIDRARRVLTAL